MTSRCMELCNPDFTPKLTAKSLAESRADYLLNSFGQIFYSQFIGMTLYNTFYSGNFIGQHKFSNVVIVIFMQSAEDENIVFFF